MLFKAAIIAQLLGKAPQPSLSSVPVQEMPMRSREAKSPPRRTPSLMIRASATEVR
jgi:hypothetical protein